MADAEGESRTEEASPHRQAEARRRGQVARSAGLTAAGGLLVFVLVASWLGAQLWSALEALVRDSLTPHAQPGVAWAALSPRLGAVGVAAAGLLLAIAAGAALSGLGQVGALFTLRALSPARPKPSLGARLRGLFSAERAAFALLASVQWLLLAAIVAWVLRASLTELWTLALGSGAPLSTGPGAAPHVDGAMTSTGAAMESLAGVLMRLLWALAFAGLFIGCVELTLRRLQLAAALRTGRSARRREQREQEGDPALRAERRRRHAELASLADLERARVLVFDATGYAVALVHGEQASDAGAPRVLARARGAFADQMRARCHQVGVAVAAPTGLARSLYRHAPGERIDRAHYEAVAEVFHQIAGEAASERASEVGR